MNTGIDYWTHERYGVHSMYRNNEPTQEDQGQYATDLFKREAIRFIQDYKDQPFFCYVPFNAPHIASVLERPRPVQAPEEYIDMYPTGESESEKRNAQYRAAITCMDDAIGEILQTLEQNGLAENTIVIFLSDNGGTSAANNKPLRGGKAQMFEGGLRVPCIIRWHEQLSAGTVCDQFLSSMEFFPMLCNATAVNPPEDVILDGFDMLPVLKGETDSSRTEMFWERRGSGCPGGAVEMGQFHQRYGVV